jgi:serine phosphatase RsbU (regulator of sigma subunit)
MIMRRVAIYLFLFAWPATLLSQKKPIDSLRHVLSAEADDTSKVNTLNDLSGDLWGIAKYDTALIYANNARELAENLGYEKGEAAANDNMGIIYGQLGDYPKSLQYFFKALKVEQTLMNKRGIARNTGNIGIVYRLQADYSNALQYFFKALNIYQELSNQSGIAINTGNIGVVYEAQGDYLKAREYYSKALVIMKKINNKTGIANNTANLGNAYEDQANEVRDKYGAARSDSLYDKALDYHMKALKMYQDMGNKHGIAINKYAIGDVLNEQKKYKQAKEEFDSSLALSKEIGEKDNMRDVYKGLSELDEATGDYKKEVQDYKMYILYRDSLINETNTKKSVQTAMNFTFEQELASQKAEQDRKDVFAEQERKRQLVLRDAFMVGFALVLVLAFLIFRGYKQKQKAHQIITRQKKEVEKQKDLVEKKQKEILDSIHYAQTIQKALLASDELLKDNLPDHFVLFRPKDIISGDFYWATQKDNRLYIAVCDSTGHGVPGAFMSLFNISFLNEAINEKNIEEPNEVLNHIRRRLIQYLSQNGRQDGMDGILAQFTRVEGKINLAYAAAYNQPLLVRDGKLTDLAADRMPVGKSPVEIEPFTLHKVELRKGDMLYLFTDGYSDQFGGLQGKKFKHQQLLQLLLANAHLPMDEQKQVFVKTLEEWKGGLEQVDDILVFGIRIS